MKYLSITLVVVFGLAADLRCYGQTSIDDAVDANHRIKNAYEDLRDSEWNIVKKIDRHNEKLAEALKFIQPEDFYGERVSMNRMRAIASDLHSLAEVIVEGHNEFRDNAKNYREVLLQSYPSFEKAGNQYLGYETEELAHPTGDKSIAASYRHQGESLFSIATKIKNVASAQTIKPAYVAVTDKLRRVKRAELFLRRFDSWSKAIPENLVQDEVLAKLALFLKLFEEFQQRIELFHGKVTSQTPISDEHLKKGSPPSIKIHPPSHESQDVSSVADSAVSRGLEWHDAGELNKAIAAFDEAIEASPGFVSAYYCRGYSRDRNGDYRGAIADFTKCLELDSTFSLAANNLAWILATNSDKSVREPSRALSLALKGCMQTGFEDANLVDTLAAAYAAAGDFGEAIYWQERATEHSSEDVHRDFEHRLALYKKARTIFENESTVVAAEDDLVASAENVRH